MKRIMVIFMLVVAAGWSVPSFAGTSDRFQGGLKRVIKSPFEVSDSVKSEGTKAKFMPFGVTGGFLKGCFYMVKEMVGGTMDMVTAPVVMLHR